MAKIILLLLLLIGIFHQSLLTFMGQWTIRNDPLLKSDVAVVLNTGAEIYPRLMAAADLYNDKYVDKILINGNRKNDALRKLEAMGYKPVVPWYANRVEILHLLGVPIQNILLVNGEDAYDTISEAEIVGHYLLQYQVKTVIVTTSKSHTKRAGYIWDKQFKHSMRIIMHPASEDPFQATSWWHKGRQIRWVMAEYGAWFFILWKDIIGITEDKK
ncbi:MAG: YdcF family protein [Gammaproteobacteria bacterium]|nr:YdcF family protein [Gammaproteobacteria bacterium]